MAQSVKRLTSAQVLISQFVSSSPMLGSVLTAQSLDPALDSVSPSLFASVPRMLYLSLSKINIKKRFFKISSTEITIKSRLKLSPILINIYSSPNHH